MIDGILDIKIVPSWDGPNVRPALVSAIADSQLLQASIAYWTINGVLFDAALIQRLSPPNGFLCVDIHMPTDIDALASLVQKGADVRIFCQDIATYRADGKKEPPHLLHTKLLLFWAKDKPAELWVGSHNWTTRALTGLNVESSLVVRLKDSCQLFCDAAEYLQKIKSICEVFDLNRVDYYKQLQMRVEEKTVPVIEVEASGAGSLHGMEISIFGTDGRDLRELGTVRRTVYLSATENDSQEAEYVYPAKITQVGELNSANPGAGQIQLSPRRYAFRVGRKFPELLTRSEVTSNVLQQAQYYVTLELQAPEKTISFEYPRTKTGSWEVTTETESPLIRRLQPDELATVFRGRRPTLKLPVQIQPVAEQALTLSERRNLIERSFLTKRIIRRQ